MFNATENALRRFAGEKSAKFPSTYITTRLRKLGLIEFANPGLGHTTTDAGYAWLREHSVGQCEGSDSCPIVPASLELDPYQYEIYGEVHFVRLCPQHLRDREDDI